MQIDRCAHEHEQQKFRRDPKLGKFQRQAARDDIAFSLERDTEAHYRDKAGDWHNPLQSVFQRDKQERKA